MDHLQEYYGAMADQEHGISSPVVGMNCAALFTGLLHVNLICLKVGRLLPVQKLCSLLHWQGRKKKVHLFGASKFCPGASENCISTPVSLSKNVSLMQ